MCLLPLPWWMDRDGTLNCPCRDWMVLGASSRLLDEVSVLVFWLLMAPNMDMPRPLLRGFDRRASGATRVPIGSSVDALTASKIPPVSRGAIRPFEAVCWRSRSGRSPCAGPVDELLWADSLASKNGPLLSDSSCSEVACPSTGISVRFRLMLASAGTVVSIRPERFDNV